MKANNSTHDFIDICRICLQKNIYLSSIVEPETVKMLSECKFWQIAENDGYPYQICLNCKEQLQTSYQFKLQCDRSRIVLQKIISAKHEDDYCNIQDHSLDPTDLNEWRDQAKSSDLKHSKSNSACNKYKLKRDILSRSSSLQTVQEDSKVGKTSKCIECSEVFNTKHICSKLAPCQIISSQPEKDTSEDLVAFLDEPLPPPLPHPCVECSQSFLTESDLDVHKSVHTGDGLACIRCQKKCTNRQMLKRHIKIHMVNKPNLCHVCGKGFAESYTLMRHALRHSGVLPEKKHFCPDCGQGFVEPFYLNIHRRKHTGERPLMCPYCDKSFADPRSVKVHLMTHTGEKPYKCHICPKAFAQSVNLTKHIRTHTGEKPYICQKCGKNFTQSSGLDKHLKTHADAKPFGCDICNKRFAEKGYLTKHLQTHSEEKQYVCVECELSFATSTKLKVHMRKHSSVKQNVCNICNKDFPSPGSLSVHMRVHTGEKPFMCPVCGRRFITKKYLTKHKKVHDKIEEGNESFNDFVGMSAVETMQCNNEPLCSEIRIENFL